MQVVDTVVLLVYIAAVFGLGCWFVRRTRNSREFMIAGGRLPGWAVGLSIFGTYLSSNTFLGVPGKTYATNFNAFVFSLSLPLAAWIAHRVFVPFYRRIGHVSAYEHLEQRFGAWARTYAVICYLLTQIARMASILFGVALGLHALTHWPVATIILCTGILVTVYTLLGGIEAVIWTDVVQSLVLMGGAFMVLGLLCAGVPDGVVGTVRIAAEHDKFSLGSWSFDFTISSVWCVLLYGLFINLNNFGIDQSFVQRYQSAKSESAALRALWTGALLYVPISFIFFLIGAALYAFYETHPDLKAEVVQQVRATAAEGDQVAAGPIDDAVIGDKVLPHFIATQLPTGMAGLLIAAIFAAAMSSVDTSMNSSATVWLEDIHRRYLDRQCTEQRAFRVLRVATVVFGVGGTALAISLIGEQSILDAWWRLQGVFAGGVLGLFLLGMAVSRPYGKAAAIATACGVIVIGWMTLSPTWDFLPRLIRNPWHANMTIVVGTSILFLVGLLLHAIMTPPAHKNRTDDISLPS
ncbi:MAG: sodium:solute symporter [Pirellulaceae bacterium]|nr:MAG: sodium:solute symporter [Pirellulaceae bacterium]